MAVQYLTESARRQSQLDLVARGHEVEVGTPDACPLPLADLLQLHAGHPAVVSVHDSGLTAVVYCVRAKGHDWAVKRARPRCLVNNVDGQTSFLNEVQRRAELTALRHAPGGGERFAGVIDTVYASVRRGIIVSPWIEGEPVLQWDERRLEQVFDTGRELVRAGFFEWDFCPGNVMDDGRRVHLFDFGYMYRFDPLRHFNSAGDGLAAPQCHLAERIETRHAFAAFLELEASRGVEAALEAFRMEKRIALRTYRRLAAELRDDGASDAVCRWLGGIADKWDHALAGDLNALYLEEGWRSHVIDLEDDLNGQTCTPATLRRTDWLLSALDTSHMALVKAGALFGSDQGLSATELRSVYEAKRRAAQGFQTTAKAA
ncbi:hypothetical protein [Rhizobacter sp. LjRoot28]|jgi:hypothetical protein|uniref:hypothetical protein n=1 Tax=Rhizobacter sp. LjRoot28 TaxID=3342309 RepID=UPI003ECE1389